MNTLKHRSIIAALILVAAANRSMWAAEANAGDSAASSSKVPPAKDAIVLFDGSSLDAWLSQTDRQWEKSDGAADWKITPEGWLEVVPGAGR